MDLEDLISRYPDIDVEELLPHFPRIPMSVYPELRDYSWEDCHRGFAGGGGLFLVWEVGRRMELQQGMHLLDLCCGEASSSIFLAKQFGVKVTALDLEADPEENETRIQAADLEDAITPVKMDARSIHFPAGLFDAVFCLNSYFYFGTDEQYLPYLTQFIRPGGRIGIASPCYSQELTQETPQEFLYDTPDFTESYFVHSPSWWRRHFSASGGAKVLSCEEHPKGREFWLDHLRWLLEKQHPRDMADWMREMVFREIVMLLKDTDRFITYLTVLGEKGDR